ncbi:MAG: response regulator transcription factor [Sphingobacteriales bacterium]|nr:MAG: response regulator transcription factor [Sphingobacteriales bacterium]
MEKIKILLADDHLLVRQAWRLLFEKQEEFILVGEASTGEEVIQLASELKPHVIMMDINMPGVNGLDATRIITQNDNSIKVLVVSMHNQVSYALTAFRFGASGYITKGSSAEEVFKAINLAYNNHKYVCEELNGVFIDEVVNNKSTNDTRVKKLTPQEKKVINFLRNGDSSKKIAEEMNISRRTVEVHRYHILKKLNLPNTVALMSFINKNNFDVLVN